MLLFLISYSMHISIPCIGFNTFFCFQFIIFYTSYSILYVQSFYLMYLCILFYAFHNIHFILCILFCFIYLISFILILNVFDSVHFVLCILVCVFILRIIFFSFHPMQLDAKVGRGIPPNLFFYLSSQSCYHH